MEITLLEKSFKKKQIPAFFHTERDIFSCHFLYFSCKKKIFLVIIFFMQIADHNGWLLIREIGFKKRIINQIYLS